MVVPPTPDFSGCWREDVEQSLVSLAFLKNQAPQIFLIFSRDNGFGWEEHQALGFDQKIQKAAE